MVVLKPPVWIVAAGLLCVAGCSRETKQSVAGEQPSSTGQNAVEPAEKTVNQVNVTVANIHGSAATVSPRADDVYPDPPPREVGEPERFIHYYCRCWKDEAFAKMYGLLHASLRERLPFKTFKERYIEDAEFNAGLKDEAILEQVKNLGSEVTWRVNLVFQSNRAKPRTVTVTLKKTRGEYRLVESGLIPIDLEDL